MGFTPDPTTAFTLSIIFQNRCQYNKEAKMNAPTNDDDDQGEVFLDENDIIQEIVVDDEGPISLSSFILCFYVYLI